MPELPEVETVRRELSKHLVGKTFLKPIVLYHGMIKTNEEDYVAGIANTTIVNISRRGKFLIFHLDNSHKILFHLRMEGKLFIVPINQHSLDHLSLFIPFKNSDEGLAFYDVRKFGVTYYLKEEKNGPLDELGPEPFEIKDSSYLYQKYHRCRKPIKELLLDQSIMSGLGNIYVDEVCFASHLSPFRPGNEITAENAKDILTNSIRILTKAIENHGSTVRSYKATQELSGSFQQFLKVYSRAGKICLECQDFKIEKRRLNGRGTSYCPKCQHTGISVAITGKIASGKSLAASYFKEEGYVAFSCDEETHKLYQDPDFLKGLKKKFPELFRPDLDKKLIGEKLLDDKVFRRKYENYLYPLLRRKANEFIIANDGKNKVLEIPLLFESKMQKDFTFLIGVETKTQDAHLQERGDEEIKNRLRFNEINSYDKHRHQMDYILTTDGPKADLKKQVGKIVLEIQRRLDK